MRTKYYLFSILKLTIIILILYFLKNKIQIQTSNNSKTTNYHVDILDCTIKYNLNDLNYSLPVPKSLEDVYVTRAIMMYIPVNDFIYYQIEFKWMYRSWIEMQKYESKRWRTDLLLFIDDKNFKKFRVDIKKLNDLNCSFENIRRNKQDPPMCSLIRYQSIADRHVNKTLVKKFIKTEAEYEFLFNKFDIFNDNDAYLSQFYASLKDLAQYVYVDSILVAFDGYKMSNGVYDFLLRSDIDVFLTPLFAKWLPRRCNDFVVGGGDYGHTFNMKRLKRVSKNLNLEHADEWNLGSTWYSTPKQFRYVSYLTLISMVYLSNEEFTSVERGTGLGDILWPEWHYGVLLLYGQHVAMNHLIATKQINIVKLPNLIDFPSYNNNSVFESAHIHVFNDDYLFSKFAFKAGHYDNMTVKSDDYLKTRYYALSNALESRKLSESDLYNMFLNQTNKA
jgi:hypothetical protein